MNRPIIGWDVGGAHLKAVALNAEGCITAVIQQPCPLWKGIPQLTHALQIVLQQLPDQNYHHAVTMTGELVDCFDNRHEGVRAIIDALCHVLPAETVFIFTGLNGFVPAKTVQPSDLSNIASANWLATTLFAAQHIENGLLVDVGSTTTDIIALQKHTVALQGYSDYERLVSQELIYTGIVRTPVMAVVQTVCDEGKIVGVMAEYFATMADVYRLTGELNSAHDQTDTADGKEKTVLASAKRLSRMIGCDFFPDELTRWQSLARDIRAIQLQRIQTACEHRLSHIDCNPSQITWIGAGVGQFLVQEIAMRFNVPYVNFAQLCPPVIQTSELQPTDCAPAIAVACLLLTNGSNRMN